MFHSFLDHLVLVAPTLAAGCAHVRSILGVDPQPGGEHERMGTHNRLLRLGETLYLEVIAVNPAAAQPDRPRWFDLDICAADAPPRLAAWVARTGNLPAALAATDEALGKIEAMRRGVFEWLITVPTDGSLPLGGAAPALIEWHTDLHPALDLEDRRLSLDRLEIHHPEPERIERLLHALKIVGPVDVVHEPAAAPPVLPRLVAHIRTPQGVCIL